MKRANGEGTIRQRKPDLWEGRYSIGVSSDGKQIQKSVYGKTQGEVRKKLSFLRIAYKLTHFL